MNFYIFIYSALLMIFEGFYIIFKSLTNLFLKGLRKEGPFEHSIDNLWYLFPAVLIS